MFQNGDLSQLTTLLDEFKQQFADEAFSFDAVKDLAFDAILSIAETQLVSIGIEAVTSLLFPFGGAILKLYRGLQWVGRNLNTLAGLVAKIAAILQAVSNGKAWVKDKVLSAFKTLTKLAFDVFATFIGLSTLRRKIADLVKCAINWLKSRVQKFINWLIDRMVGRNRTTCPACLRRAMMLAGPRRCGSCFAGRVVVWTAEGDVAIREMPMAALVRTGAPRRGEGQRYGRGDEWRLHVVEAMLVREEGWVRLRMLRETAWLDARGAVVGGMLWLDMEEMGVVGWARVSAIGPCPELPERREGYALVTAWFEHSSGVVLDVRVAGESEALVVTPSHPVWCADQQAYYPGMKVAR